MPNTLTLDAIRNEARRKYAPVKFGLSDGSEVEFTAFLRLPEKKRDFVLESLEDLKALDDTESQDEITEEEADLLCETVAKILEAAATSSPAALITEILDEPDPLIRVATMTEVLNQWMAGTQLGEAGNSPS